jgi:hypothetical protein
VALGAWARFKLGYGVSSMMVVMLVAGIGLVVAGLLAIGFGIPVKEFSFGNTLILTGVIGICTGMIMLGLATTVRELKHIARRLGDGIPAASGADIGLRPVTVGVAAPGDGGPLFGRDQSVTEGAGSAEAAARASRASPPWHDEAASRDRGRNETSSPPAPEPVEAAPVPKRRNLLFSSTSRRERERAEARASEPSAPDLLAPDLRPGAPPPAPESSEPSPAAFEDTWPKSERARPADLPPRRTLRTPSTFEAIGTPAPAPDRHPPPREEQQAPVTVLKSGVVDGMAYSLYSDGSIEAQMPEGMMRFASIDELRKHLDQRS